MAGDSRVHGGAFIYRGWILACRRRQVRYGYQNRAAYCRKSRRKNINQRGRRIHRVAADAVGGPAVPPRRTAGDGPGNGGRPGGADAAGAANHAHADRGARLVVEWREGRRPTRPPAAGADQLP